jgi:hypothetical protein
MIGLAFLRALAIERNHEGLKRLAEEFGIHVLLEVSLVGIIDSFLRNTVLSMLVGICIIEGFQFFWRKWRAQETE